MKIKDSYFGEMDSDYDKYSNCYYLDKDIELECIHTPVILYIISDNGSSKKNQQEVFELIRKDFVNIWKSVVIFLTSNKKIITDSQLRKEYRLESITLPQDIELDTLVWEMDIANLKDGFSRIIVEMKNNEPIHFSIEG